MQLSDTVLGALVGGAIVLAGKMLEGRQKRVELTKTESSTLRVEHIHDRQSLTDDQAALITNLQTQCNKLQQDVERLNKEWIEAQKQIMVLQGEVKDNARTIESLRDENRKSRQDCEEQISHLADENSTLREQLSGSQRENLMLATALKERGGSPEEAVKQGRRRSDKKGSSEP